MSKPVGLDRRWIMMTKQTLSISLFVLAVAACKGADDRNAPMQKTTTAPAAPAAAAPTPVAPPKTGRVAANGLDYYYEIHGQGEPVLVLHGGLGSIDMFRPILPSLGEGRQLIAVDLQ